MAIWRSLDPGWGVTAVRVVMGLILLNAGWAGARLDLMLLAGGVLLLFAGSGRLSIDEVWLEPRRG